jgi:hypothetical protein
VKNITKITHPKFTLPRIPVHIGLIPMLKLRSGDGSAILLVPFDIQWSSVVYRMHRGTTLGSATMGKPCSRLKAAVRRTFSRICGELRS